MRIDKELIIVRSARIFRLLFLQITSLDPRKRRLLGILQGLATSLGNKAVGILTSFLSVPLTIHYLGPERYGIWLTISSLFAWLALTDFGIGLGLNTSLARAVGEERPDLVRRHVTTALIILSGLALLVGVIATAAWPWIDWSSLLGARTPAVQAEVRPALALALAFWLLQFPMSVFGRVYTAYAEGRLANYWGMVGNILNLTALVIVTQTQGGLIWLVAALAGAGLAVNLASGIYLFALHRPSLRPRLRDFSTRASKELLGAGGYFFIIQILSLIVFQSDNIVIGHFLGAGEVPTYSLTYTLFNYCLILQTLAFSYLWVAYTEAIARGDIAWVRRTNHLCIAGGTALTLVFATCLCFIVQPFIAWWAGPQVVPPLSLVVWMAAWAVINAYTSPIACLLAASTHMRNQTIYSSLAVVMNVVLTITLVQSWRQTGVIAATVMSYLVFVCGPTLVDSERLLSQLQRRADANRRSAVPI